MGPRELRRRPVVAIDGPGASGKTTVGLGLAARLGYRLVDTGVMYRAVTLLALERGVSVDADGPLEALARAISIDLRDDRPGTPPRVFVDGHDVTAQLNAPRIDRAVSRVSMAPGVRAEMVRRQRALAGEGGIVMVGRDIGTVVLPDAGLKVFLDASAEERARRRHRERQAQGESVSYESVLEELRRRDRLDSERAISPLAPAADARHIDTDGHTAAQVIDAICELLDKD
jgi:cytidylate kinase